MLIEALLKTKARSPRAVAVADGVRSLTYRQMAVLAAAIRRVVTKQTTCERVGIILPASSSFPPVLFGVLWSSKIAIPLNFLLNHEELAKVVEDARIDTVITVRHFAELAEKLPVRAVFLEDLSLKRRMVWASLWPLPRAPKVDPHATAVILYTSGTTAAPKGVELTHGNLYSNCVDSIASLEIESTQVFLNVLPPFHVFGLTGNVLIPVVLGASVFAIPRFSPVAMARAIADQGITVIMAIPSMYAALLRTKSSKRDAFRSIYLAISGGEPLPDRVRRGFEERFGVVLKQGYGLTETSPVVASSSPTQYKDNTVGRPIRNVEIRILAADGQPASEGADGDILVRGPGVMKGYFGRPEETRAVLDGDGWFATGDMGRLDEEGYLRITGRAKEMLIIGGENVFPREIEAVLEAYDGVMQAAVIGMSDDLRGEVPAAFVIPAAGAELNEDALRNFAKKALAGFKVPRKIVVREDLPTGPTGKILKRQLQALL